MEPADAWAALKWACETVGLNVRGATLVRLGGNAIFRLTYEPVVARIARDVRYLEEARREIEEVAVG